MTNQQAAGDGADGKAGARLRASHATLQMRRAGGGGHAGGETPFQWRLDFTVMIGEELRQ